MGNTTGTGINKPSPAELADYVPGQRWQSKTGCVPNLDDPATGAYFYAKQQGLLDISPEFDWAGRGDACNMCSFHYGYSDCDANIAGSRPTITRKTTGGYLADPSQCCMGGQKIINDLTCHPQYRDGPNSTACNDVFAKYCNKDRIFTDQKCKIWDARISDDPTWKSAADTSKLNYCAEHPENPICSIWGGDQIGWKNIVQNYCKGDKLGGDFCKTQLIKLGGSDPEVIDWCKSHADDKFCSCFKQIEYTGTDQLAREILQNTQCYSGDCQKYGYMTQTQRNFTCPSTVRICDNSINVSDINQSVISDISQKCSYDDGSTPQIPNDGASLPPLSDIIILIILILAIVVVLGLTIWWLFEASEDQDLI